jgi:hypothetical protein
MKNKYFISIISCSIIFSFILLCSLTVNTGGKTIKERFPIPNNYKRVTTQTGSFENYLQNFPLKPHGSSVYYYNNEKRTTAYHAAVLDIDVGKYNLQQCADACMRLRAEYLFTHNQKDNITFNFTNGFKADFKTWSSGKKIAVKGNKVYWVNGNGNKSYESYREYMNKVFTYASTLSLSKEMQSLPLKAMKIGDVFIQGGSPGHAVIVVDMAIDPKTGKKLFMIAQSYMPAQSIHILKNLNNKAISPWYELKEGMIYTPEWTFSSNDLKRFR